jgi:hypothetical protein
MGIIVFVIFAFGVYMFVKKARGRQLSPEAQEASGRLGRSIHASVPLPGLMGQAPASMMPERGPDEIGPDESHILTVPSPHDAREAPGGDLGPLRDGRVELVERPRRYRPK